MVHGLPQFKIHSKDEFLICFFLLFFFTAKFKRGFNAFSHKRFSWKHFIVICIIQNEWENWRQNMAQKKWVNLEGCKRKAIKIHPFFIQAFTKCKYLRLWEIEWIFFVSFGFICSVATTSIITHYSNLLDLFCISWYLICKLCSS